MKREQPKLSGAGECESPIKVIIRISLPPKKRKEAVSILSSYAEGTSLLGGCDGSRVYQDLVSGRFVMLAELWTSAKEMERHLASDQFLSVLLVMEMATEAPDVRFERISHCSGIEAIQMARAGLAHPNEEPGDIRVRHS
jgi:quinol monooxygenase YgiN